MPIARSTSGSFPSCQRTTMSPPSSPLSPAYTATPQVHECRLAFDPRLRPNRPPRLFVKQTKNGNLSLRLIDQDDRTPLPVYGLGASVQGTVEISKTEGITSVEVQASRSFLSHDPNVHELASRSRVTSSWKKLQRVGRLLMGCF